VNPPPPLLTKPNERRRRRRRSDRPTVFVNDWPYSESSIDALLVTRVAMTTQALHFTEDELVEIAFMRLHVIDSRCWTHNATLQA
jgi:hypothetical protein